MQNTARLVGLNVGGSGFGAQGLRLGSEGSG